MDGYLQETEIENMEEKEREVELIKNIIKTRRELKNVDRNFEYAQDDLVDYYKEMFNAKNITKQRMYLDTDAALKLLEIYTLEEGGQ